MNTILVQEAENQSAWDAFLSRQRFRPFLQSWTMGEVYGDVGQAPVRLAITRNEAIVATCFGHVVRARRGTHLSVPYGPVFDSTVTEEDIATVLPKLFGGLLSAAKSHGCCAIRMSPFLSPENGNDLLKGMNNAGIRTLSSPLHLLAEHIWYIPLKNPDPWNPSPLSTLPAPQVTEETIFAGMRKTTRNLIRRAEKEGVTIERSVDPVADLPSFIALHDETRKRHGFTPYSNAFFRAQVVRFSKRNECTLYKARYQGKIIAASVHMHAYGETSYHHGASTHEYAKIPASYLLQWTAVCDALKRGDHIYSFWGVSPEGQKKHPFAGVRLFKTGFGGNLLELMHCRDIPIDNKYYVMRCIETLRKWRRGF